MPRLLLIAAITAGVFVATQARAGGFDDPYDLPDAPRPPTLPELTHSDLEATLESTFGARTPNQLFLFNTTFAQIQRLTLEAPIVGRRWFLGTNYPFAFGGAEGTGALKLVSGNLEVYARTVWATRTGLAFGGGLGLMAPTASFDDGSPAASVAKSAATLRPWDVSFFTSGNFGIRPFVDVRAVPGRFVVQFREGLDVSFGANDGYRRLLAISGLYLGYRFDAPVAAGIEAFELYVIDDAGTPDKLRATVVVSPSVRFFLPYVQPALSFFTNVGTPLNESADQIWGFRLAVTVLYDPRAKTIRMDGKDVP